MLLDILFVAQLEHRERLHNFNVRAARGEFVRYADSEPNPVGLPRASERLRHLRHLIHSAVSGTGLFG